MPAPECSVHNFSMSVSVIWRGTPGRVQVHDDGSVTFLPSEDAPVRCCGGVRVAKTWPAGDIVGAQECKSKGAPATQLHTCPIKSSKNGQVVRQLHTEAPFVTADSDPEIAGTLVQAVRRTLEAPAVGRGNGRIVIVSNGNAGKGRGSKIGAAIKEGLLASGRDVVLHETTHAGHAIEIAAGLDASKTACIVPVGGDGTFHEVLQVSALQGLYRHAAPQQALGIALCHVPAGSGNGLAASAGLWAPDNAVHAILHGAVCEMDAASVVQPSSGTKLLAVLSVHYAMLCDLDMGTEHLRRVLGGERITYGAVREILKWKTHAAHVASVPTPIIDEVLKHWPQAGVPANDVQYPEGWVDERQEAIRFFALQGPEWAALDFRLNPWGKLSDGAWDLITDKCKTRMEGLAMLQLTQTGAHKDSPLFEHRKVGAFAIHPDTSVGGPTWLSVDGEVVPMEPLLLEVHKGLLRMVCAAPVS